MRGIDANELKKIYAGAYQDYCNQDWAVEWRKNYAQQVRKVQEADWETWQSHSFQESLWDSNAVASIGPGQAVTVRGAYGDSELVKYLFNARGLLNNVAVEEKGAKLQKLYEEVLEMVHGVHAKRRPRARLTRLLASMFPNDMTSIADANRIWGVQKLISAPRVGGHFIAQHPTVRDRKSVV